ncbi:NAD(P)H-dependent oxidoreductase [Arthrobacter sp. BE255]|uniref:FMN-dependent NADH-azoreductase n=1 Tax=Arthrobacter sp. BE255 TaxID=2817721 RepID=UPI00286565D2|nr:NAD(P)H-dependent oxidoreductase [Arthrobacter sp. BE255]MDR7159149.1 FMN-dependent NADH-azoreductase [Arthrobacter sp. BE255]
MATLLHLDSSINDNDNSASRALTALFRQAWEREHPEGKVIYRDLAAEPLPHIDTAAHYAWFTSEGEQSPEQQAAYALRIQLIEELEEADAIVIGAPMYNYSVPSTVKAWIDHVSAAARTILAEHRTAAGKPITVVTSRGGSYAPGTPQEGNDYVQNYLEAVLGGLLGMKIDFITPELTLAPVNPAMSELIPLFEQSRGKSREEAEAKGKAIAAQVAA